MHPLEQTGLSHLLLARLQLFLQRFPLRTLLLQLHPQL